MKMKKIISVMLIAIMTCSFGIVANAADVSLNTNTTGQSSIDATAGDIGVYFNVDEEINGLQFVSPSFSNSTGTLVTTLYLWEEDYTTTVAGTPLYSQEFVNYKDCTTLKFLFPTAPAGEYIIVFSTPVKTDGVGLWLTPNVTEAAQNWDVKVFHSGQVKAGSIDGEIITGKSPTLGNLVIRRPGEEDEEIIDIGTELTSNIPVMTFDEKIKDSIIMYTGSSTAYVGAKTKMIDKYNKFVTPIIMNDCTMLPIRFVAENLGATLTWDDASQVITLVKGDLVVEMQVGTAFMKVNGENRTLQVAPTIIQGRTMVPLRGVTEALNIPIHWRQDGANGLIIVGETCEDLGEDLTVIGTLLSKLKKK